jgi:hypothetical protein
MRRIVLISLLCFMCFFFNEAASQVVFSEVLANEPGSWVYLEWVELFNRGETEVDLSGWLFIEGSDTTELPQGTAISGRGFLVLARHLLTSSEEMSFERYWGDSSGVWGDDPGENYPAFEVKMSLGNPEGEVTLWDGSSYQTSFSWNSDAGAGVSWERIDLDGPDEPANWWPCPDPRGSTPGWGESHRDYSPERFVIEVDPEVFVGKEESTTIKYQLPPDTELTLKLYDIEGRLRKSFEVVEGNRIGEIEWSGDDDNDEPLPGGIYILYAGTSGGYSGDQTIAIAVAKRF